MCDAGRNLASGQVPAQICNFWSHWAMIWQPMRVETLIHYDQSWRLRICRSRSQHELSNEDHCQHYRVLIQREVTIEVEYRAGGIGHVAVSFLAPRRLDSFSTTKELSPLDLLPIVDTFPSSPSWGFLMSFRYCSVRLCADSGSRLKGCTIL